MLIFHSGLEESYVLAAGNEFLDRGDDFSRFNAWHVYPKGAVSRSAHADAVPPSLLGDALYLEVLESASGIVYWNGSEYAWSSAAAGRRMNWWNCTAERVVRPISRLRMEG